MSPPTQQFRLPDLLSGCPLKDATNPYYKEAAAESQAWINSYDIFIDRKRAFFIQGQNELLCSHVYAYAGRDQFRVACDFINLLFVIDETSDEQTGNGAKATGRTFIDALKFERDDGSKIATITKDFRTRLISTARGNNPKRLFHLCDLYMESVGEEAELRERGVVLGLEEYMPHRQHNSGVLTCFAVAEYILGINLADEVFEDPTFMAGYMAACDFVCWSNDLYSYDREQSKGLMGNNVISVLMKEKKISLQEASDYVGNHCNHLVNTYVKARKQLPKSLGPEAAQLIDSIGHWMIGSIVWSFETSRYFGSRHLEVKKTRWVTIRPRLHTDDDGCDLSDDDSEGQQVSHTVFSTTASSYIPNFFNFHCSNSSYYLVSFGPPLLLVVTLVAFLAGRA